MDGGVLADRPSNGEGFGFFCQRAVMEETLAVDVLRYIAPVEKSVGVVDLVKRVICQNQSHPT